MKYGFGMIDLLIGLIIIAGIYMLSMSTFKSTVNINGSSDTKSIQQQVDEQVKEIENMRRQTIELNKNTDFE